MPSRRRIGRYQQLSEFERGRTIELKKEDFSIGDIAKYLVGMYQMCIVVCISGLDKVLFQEIRDPTAHGSPLTEKTTI
ncbi:hypothetical protein TNCV_2715901 [Trichonephila clavipes]|nr:hypothetical protein TNCV_2715901 [Trichonephila clavipes]